MKTPRHFVASALADRTLKPGMSASDIKQLGDEIAAYLLEEHRTGELDSLLRDIMQFRADRGIVEVTAVSTFLLSEKARAEVVAEVRSIYPEASQIIVSHRHDPNLVAGVKLEFANQQLDLSIRNKLNRLKQGTSTHGTF